MQPTQVCPALSATPCVRLERIIHQLKILIRVATSREQEVPQDLDRHKPRHHTRPHLAVNAALVARFERLDRRVQVRFRPVRSKQQHPQHVLHIRIPGAAHQARAATKVQAAKVIVGLLADNTHDVLFAKLHGLDASSKVRGLTLPLVLQPPAATLRNHLYGSILQSPVILGLLFPQLQYRRSHLEVAAQSLKEKVRRVLHHLSKLIRHDSTRARIQRPLLQLLRALPGDSLILSLATYRQDAHLDQLLQLLGHLVVRLNRPDISRRQLHNALRCLMA